MIEDVPIARLLVGSGPSPRLYTLSATRRAATTFSAFTLDPLLGAEVLRISRQRMSVCIRPGTRTLARLLLMARRDVSSPDDYRSLSERAKTDRLDLLLVKPGRD